MFDINIAPYKSVSRQITGAIHHINNEINPDGQLVKYTIEKTAPNGKMFGFIVSQLIRVEAIGNIDNIQKGDKLAPTIGIKDGEEVELPNFYVDEVIYDKVNNTTKIVGYDILEQGKDIPISQVELTYPTTLGAVAAIIATKLGATLVYEGLDYEIVSQANLSGQETLKSVLSAIAEASGTICYITKQDEIKFRKLDTEVLDTLTPANYFELTTGATTTLTQIASATELGNNVSYGEEGYTQAFWNNPFFDALNEEDLAALLETLGNEVIGLTAVDYTIKWRGCPAYEIGDYITIQEKDNSEKNIYYFDEVFEYSGGLISTSDWKAGDGENISTNPTSLGAVLSQTSAKVDKVNQEIELLAIKVGEVDVSQLQEDVASLKLTTDSITQEVSRVETYTEDAIETLTNKVSNTVTAEDVSILIEQGISDGVNQVTTETGYVFDKDGLTISKSNSEMSTQITEDGMTISKKGDTVLTVNNVGVQATNLHATTYLIIGDTSRFEDYNENGQLRTGCFWQGLR